MEQAAEFIGFPKMARLSRDMIVTEKIDGTSGCIYITESGEFLVGSRTRWITPEKDNHGFAAWAYEHQEELVQGLGHGRHFGEWWGCLSSETSVRLSDGTLEKIGKIVNGKLDVEVLSYNFDTQAIEPKRVVEWKRGPTTEDWLTIGFKRKFRGGRQPHLNLTPNHILYRATEDGCEEVSAGEVRVGDKLFLGLENPSHLQQQLISGSLLGDGSVADHCFSVGHSNHALVDTKTMLLGNLITSVTFSTSGHGSAMKVLHTKALPFLRSIEEELFTNGAKGITVDFVNTLGPVALAFWYADDGHIAFSKERSPICELSTRGFAENSVRNVSASLKLRGYDNYVFLVEGQPVIRFTPNGTKRFQLDIAPYVPWEMKYKMLPSLREIVPAWEQSTLIEDAESDLVTTEVVSVDDTYTQGDRSKVRYDIEVEGNHNFFANGVLVHNSGIQRGYGLPKGEKRFSLFNVQRWCLHGTKPQRIITGDPRQEKYQEELPECVGLVPILYRGPFSTDMVETCLDALSIKGSTAAPGFMYPEGLVVHHVAGNVSFKKTLLHDEIPKTLLKDS